MSTCMTAYFLGVAAAPAPPTAPEGEAGAVDGLSLLGVLAVVTGAEAVSGDGLGDANGEGGMVMVIPPGCAGSAGAPTLVVGVR